MTMAHNGLSKLMEECGEVTQIAAKIQALPVGQYDHWDGQDLKQRLTEEIADVVAACELVSRLHGLDKKSIHQRADKKLAQFLDWHADPKN